MNEEQARRQIRKERKFYSHLGTYVVVCSALSVMSMLTSEYFWAIWPILGWGIGLASHALSVFGVPGRRKDWEEQRMRQLTGAEGTANRLRTLVDEAVEARTPVRRGGRAETAEEARLRQRVEHLEAIVTSHDWDAVATAPPATAAPVPATPVPPAPAPRPAVELPDDHAEEETPEARAARLARRIR